MFMITCYFHWICFLSQELISANGERHHLTEENNHLDERLKELTAEYTNRLQQYIHDIGVSYILILSSEDSFLVKPKELNVC